ncbi:MAG: fatty acid desaturase [Planctomycetales bacterium]|nr:fatty acid desaturase [Planctomycetales bacterium]
MATTTTEPSAEYDIDEQPQPHDETPAAERTLPWPATATNPVRVRWRYAIGIPLVHVLACLAFFPYFFSWTGVVLAVLGLYVFGTLGINLCYHRLLTHQGFVVPKKLEHALAVLGVCTLQDTPACWVAMHRIHHRHSDEQPDPHSPLVAFLWGHCGWLMFVNRDFVNINYYQKYTRDLLRDPFYLNLERGWKWLFIYLASMAVFFLAGFGIGAASGGLAAGVQFGASLVVWGVFVRTIATWHITWSVNSVTHVWGYRNYETSDNSRNNILVGLWSNGEGWHNNHHADQRAAAHGHKWWEFDVTWITIRVLEKLGLARDIVRPKSWKDSAATPSA